MVLPHGSSLSRGPGSNGNLQPQDDGLTGQGMVGEAGLERERERGGGLKRENRGMRGDGGGGEETTPTYHVCNISVAVMIPYLLFPYSIDISIEYLCR